MWQEYGQYALLCNDKAIVYWVLPKSLMTSSQGLPNNSKSQIIGCVPHACYNVSRKPLKPIGNATTRYIGRWGRNSMLCSKRLYAQWKTPTEAVLFAPQFKPRLSGSTALLPKPQGLYAQRPTRTRWKKPNRTLDWKSASALVGTTRI